MSSQAYHWLLCVAMRYLVLSCAALWFGRFPPVLGGYAVCASVRKWKQGMERREHPWPLDLLFEFAWVVPRLGTLQVPVPL